MEVRLVENIDDAPEPGAMDVAVYFWEFEPESPLVRDLNAGRTGMLNRLITSIERFFEKWELRDGSQVENRLPQTLIVLCRGLAQEYRDRILKAGAFVCDFSGGDGEGGESDEKEIILSRQNLAERLEAVLDVKVPGVRFSEEDAGDEGEARRLGLDERFEPVEELAGLGVDVVEEIPGPVPVVPRAGTEAEFRAFLEYFNR